MTAKIALALHGGVGARQGDDHRGNLAHMRGLVEAARDRLRAGAASVDVVAETTRALEASGRYEAGRGAFPNAKGVYELDASIMEGTSSRAGAVAALTGFESPIAVARAVMERTPYVLLAAQGAADFAAEEKYPRITDSTAWYIREEEDPQTNFKNARFAPPDHGTVGCVALDERGGLSAATSTGGFRQKPPGRIGDSPIIGAGTWADKTVAVSCTGHGECFIRACAAAQVSFRMRLARQSLTDAVAGTLTEIRGLGGDGGMIALAADGELAMRFNSTGMFRAALSSNGVISAAVFIN